MTKNLSPGQLLAESVWRKIADLSPDERVTFFATLTGNWCEACGYVQPIGGCRCEDDS